MFNKALPQIIRYIWSLIIFIIRMASAKKQVNVLQINASQKKTKKAKWILSTGAFGSNHLLVLLISNGAVVLNGQNT